MEKYYNLLAKKKFVNYQIKQEKLSLHKKFVNNYKGLFRVLDFIIIAMMVLNLLTVMITNIIVVKKEPTTVFYETNIVQAKSNDYEPHPKANTIFFTFIKQILLWLVVMMCYVYFRRTTFTEEGLFLLLIIILYFTISILTNFFNDFGYYIGKILFGG